MKSGLNSSTMQKRNRTTVFKTLNESKGMTRSELAKNLGLQKATITNIINEFLEIGIVEIDGDAAAGKRGEKLKLNIDGIYVLTLGITRKDFDICLYLLDGRVEKQIRHEFSKNESLKNALNRMKNLLSEIMNLYDKKRIIGVCLSVPGLYIRDRKENKEIYSISKFSEWDEINIRNELENVLERKIIIEHDAKLAAYGEWKNADEVLTDHNISLLSIRSRGFGIGGGMVINGKMVQGSMGIAGELGHMGINFNAKDQVAGSMEQYAGTDSVIKYVQSRLVEFPESPLNEESTYCEIITQYYKKDELAVWAVNRMAYMLGYGLANIIYLMNPDCIVIGHDYPDDIRFIDTVREAVLRYVPDIIMKNTVIRYSKLEGDSFLIGAYYYIMEELYKDSYIIDEIRKYI